MKTLVLTCIFTFAKLKISQMMWSLNKELAAVWMQSVIIQTKYSLLNHHLKDKVNSN
jgi:hypothetical protein